MSASPVAGSAGCVPSVRTVMFNGLVQTPRGIVPKVQLYATIGGATTGSATSRWTCRTPALGPTSGGGVKIDLVGPLRLRLDYRIFKLTDTVRARGLEATSQRFYAGANLAF